MRFPPALLDDIRARIPISDVVGRRVTWDKRKTNERRGDYWACCPVHGEKTPSFHADNRKGRYYCFGCGASGDHFRFLVEVDGLSFPEAVAELAREAGIPLPDARPLSPEAEAERQRRLDEMQRRHEKRRKRAELRDERHSRAVREIAWQIWKSGMPIGGTLAERYLRSRGIDIDLGFPSLRFVESLAYPNDDLPREEWETWPAMVCAVVGPDERFRGIWRIYLSPSGGKAPLEYPKLGLAETKGGAVWFGKPVGKINVCEGVETGLAVRALSGGEPTAAALSTSLMRAFVPPSGVTFVLIWPDGDTEKIRKMQGRERLLPAPGLAAAQDLHERLKSEGVPSAVQPTPKDGRDYLDLYCAMGGRAA